MTFGWSEPEAPPAGGVGEGNAPRASGGRLAQLDALCALGLDDALETNGAALSILDVCEGLGTHFHEHHEAVMRWPWKLFCAKWRRLMVQTTQRAAERERGDLLREHERAERDAEEALQRAHRAQWGG